MLANIAAAFVFPVTVPVGGAVMQHLVFRANHAVEVFVIHVFPPFVPALHGHRPLVRCGDYPVVIEYLLANPWCLKCRVGYDRFHLRESLF